MEDISINIGNHKFNFRVSAIIIHNGKILFHKTPGVEHYALIGGRVKEGETTRKALKREIKEELGKEIEILEPLSFTENFFEMKNSEYHEILVAYRAEFINPKDKKILSRLENIEPDKNTVYEWVDIKEIGNTDIRPKVIKEIIENKKAPAFLENNGK